MAEFEQTTQRLANARQQDNLNILAEALVQHANELVQIGEIQPAREELDEAACLHRELGHLDDETQCLQLAATLCRLHGDFQGAQIRAEQVVATVEPGTPLAVSATAELGEIAFAQGDTLNAATFYAQALEHGSAAGLIVPMQIELLRKRAIALTVSERSDEAIQALEKALALAETIDDPFISVQIQIERATALQHARLFTEAEQVIRVAEEKARALEDPLMLSDVNLLQTTQNIELGNLSLALSFAYLGRDYALQAVAPVQYVSAVLAIAQIAEAKGDYLSVYEAIAVGWVTLSDLLGHEVAQSIFEPKLIEMRDRWGAEVFKQVKRDYEAQR